MRYKAFAVFVALNVSLMAGSSYAADENAGANTQENAPIGRVTAAFGTATITGPDGKHPGDVDTLFKNQERIATDGGGVTLLLASRVVIKVDARSALMIAESVGQTIVNLEYGTAHVYVGRRPITSGMVCVQDPCVRAETDSGVFLVSYDPDRKEGYYACEHDKLNLQTINGPEHKIALTGDTQATLINGKLDVCCLDRVAFDDRVKSLDRLGESNDQQGSQTFRLRSRTIDMQQAISQLSASGWITGGALPNQLAPLAATAKTDKHGKSTVTTDSPKSTSTDTPGLTISSNTTLNVSPANGSPAVSSPPAASDTNAPTTPAASGTGGVPSASPPALNINAAPAVAPAITIAPVAESPVNTPPIVVATPVAVPPVDVAPPIVQAPAVAQLPVIPVAAPAADIPIVANASAPGVVPPSNVAPAGQQVLSLPINPPVNEPIQAGVSALGPPTIAPQPAPPTPAPVAPTPPTPALPTLPLAPAPPIAPAPPLLDLNPGQAVAQLGGGITKLDPPAPVPPTPVAPPIVPVVPTVPIASSNGGNPPTQLPTAPPTPAPVAPTPPAAAPTLPTILNTPGPLPAAPMPLAPPAPVAPLQPPATPVAPTPVPALPTPAPVAALPPVPTLPLTPPIKVDPTLPPPTLALPAAPTLPAAPSLPIAKDILPTLISPAPSPTPPPPPPTLDVTKGVLSK